MGDVIADVTSKTYIPWWTWAIIIVLVLIVLAMLINKIINKIFSQGGGGKFKLNLKDKSISLEKGDEDAEKSIFSPELVQDVNNNIDKQQHACGQKDCMRTRAIDVLQLMEKLEEYLNDKWVIRLKLNLKDQMKLVESKLRIGRQEFYSKFLTFLKERMGENSNYINCVETHTYGKAINNVVNDLRGVIRDMCSDDHFEKYDDDDSDGESDWTRYKKTSWADLRSQATTLLDNEFPYFIDTFSRRDIFKLNAEVIEEMRVKKIVFATFDQLRDIVINHDVDLKKKKKAYQEEVRKVFK